MTLSLLLIEDNPADARLVREALAERSQPTRLHWVADGEGALKRLHDEPALRPDLVLLDLNLPGLHGLEVLAMMKADPQLRSLPVVVLTSSSAPQDIADAYAAHVNSYVLKPPAFSKFVEVIDTICTYWSANEVLPTRSIPEAQR